LLSSAIQAPKADTAIFFDKPLLATSVNTSTYLLISLNFLGNALLALKTKKNPCPQPNRIFQAMKDDAAITLQP
jgi:hypothetical protein